MSGSDNGGVVPSSVDPELPDNEAELDAWRDSKDISKGESDRANDNASSFWDSIFGGKK